MKVKIFVLLAIVYFFFNSFGLPLGLTYLMILSPVFFLKTISRYVKFYALFGTIMLFYFGVHSISGIDNTFEYFKSLTLHFIVAVIAVSFYDQLKRKTYQVAYAIEVLAVLNVVAIVFVFIIMKVPVIGEKVWRTNSVSANQLRMLVYEPSYYALLLVPIFFYFYNLILNSKTLNNILIFSSIIISFLLTRSLGVIAAIVISIAIYYWDFSLLKKKKNLYIALIFFGSGSIILTCLFTFFPDYVLVKRTISFIQGDDISGVARVFDPWTLGHQIMQQKSNFFGVGWGHIKLLGRDIIYQHYNYSKFSNITVRIPNSAAEVFTTLGYIGLVLKIVIEFFLYKRTKVKYSRYRSLIFWFIFVYQFTGSYSSNLAEYVLWILAFTKTIDSDFDYQRVFKITYKYKRSSAGIVR